MTCDSCGTTISGASKRDVLAAGWKSHLCRGGLEFVMCGECEDRYALFRRARPTAPVGEQDDTDRAA